MCIREPLRPRGASNPIRPQAPWPRHHLNTSNVVLCRIEPYTIYQPFLKDPAREYQVSA